MNKAKDENEIREVIATWLKATAAEDLETVLGLMAEDVVFLRPGCPPLMGRQAFADASRGQAGKTRIEGTPDIREIRVEGDFACCWNYLSMTITPLDGGAPVRYAGNILSVFRREPGGRWVLFRDANMLQIVP